MWKEKIMFAPGRSIGIILLLNIANVSLQPMCVIVGGGGEA